MEKKMRTVMNPTMRGTSLALRYTRDRDGVSIQVQCDDRGCVEVPEEEAVFLLSTPGWRSPAKQSRLPTSAPPEPSPVEKAPSKPPALPEGSGGDDEEKSEPSIDDITALRTKAAATAYATRWCEAGYEIPELDQDFKLSEMKDVLVDALFDDDESEEE